MPSAAAAVAAGRGTAQPSCAAAAGERFHRFRDNLNSITVPLRRAAVHTSFPVAVYRRIIR